MHTVYSHTAIICLDRMKTIVFSLHWNRNIYTFFLYRCQFYYSKIESSIGSQLLHADFRYSNLRVLPKKWNEKKKQWLSLLFRREQTYWARFGFCTTKCFECINLAPHIKVNQVHRSIMLRESYCFICLNGPRIKYIKKKKQNQKK